MFNNKRRKGETEIINKIMEEMIEETGKIKVTGDMDELEERIEALENPPKFKEGDVVSFFVADKELVGEINDVFSLGPNREEGSRGYEIRYVNKNDSVEYIIVNEKNIFSLKSEQDEVCERLEDLEDQVDFLANELNKLKKK